MDWPCVCGSRMARMECICGGDDGYHELLSGLPPQKPCVGCAVKCPTCDQEALD